jgi:hypothetical protein
MQATSKRFTRQKQIYRIVIVSKTCEYLQKIKVRDYQAYSEVNYNPFLDASLLICAKNTPGRF